MTLDRANLGNQLLSLLFMTVAIGLTATLVAVVAYDAGFADGVNDTLVTLPVSLEKTQAAGSAVNVTGSPTSYPASYPVSYSQ